MSRLLVILHLLAAIACGLGSAGPAAAGTALPPPVPCRACYHPPVHLGWQWQINPLNTHVDLRVPAGMFDIDVAFTTAVRLNGDIARLHRLGRRVFCYIDVGSSENFRTAQSGAPFWFQFARFRKSDLGRPYLGYEDSERWLDIRSPHVRLIMEMRFRYAKTAGCDGVEPDNIEAYEHDQPDRDPNDHGSGFNLSARDQVDYDVFIANAAHRLGLAVLQKNSGALAEAHVVGRFRHLDYFDGALVEECVRFRFCDDFVPFVRAGKAVLDTEYVGDPSKICPQLERLRFNGIRKRQDLDAWVRACR